MSDSIWQSFELTILDRDDLVVSVKLVNDDLAPIVVTGQDAYEERDYGNVDWPSDAEVSAEVSRQLGREVKLRFRDAGDGLDESIYGPAESAAPKARDGEYLRVEARNPGGSLPRDTAIVTVSWFGHPDSVTQPLPEDVRSEAQKRGVGFGGLYAAYSSFDGARFDTLAGPRTASDFRDWLRERGYPVY